MQGFSDGVPLTVAVSWLKNPDGTYQEVPLLDGQPYDFGLLAYTNGGAQITRWFVPWSSVVYIKQTQTAAPAGQAVTPPSAPVTPPGDRA